MRILDLFCGAGGAGAGYYQAGFDEVVGVDLEPQPNYPHEFIQADALTFDLSGFDAVHASPPCQKFSKLTAQWKNSSPRSPRSNVKTHLDLIAPTRDRLLNAGMPYVIENVPGAPLLDPLRVCGSSLELGVRRHRLFELNGFSVPQLSCDHKRQGKVVGVYGSTGGSSKRDGLSFGTKADWCEAMGIYWMTARELAQAIPPLYTCYIGVFLLAELHGRVARPGP